MGIISPTYNRTLPHIVEVFLQKLQLRYERRPYVYYVGTFGTTTGAAAAAANWYMKAAGCGFDAVFDVKMPDTWTPVFDLSDREKVREINRRADIQLEEVKEQIAGRVTGKQIYDSSTRCTEKLTVEDSCIGCSLCAGKCPVHAIEMRSRRPVWVKDKCEMGLGCLHRCPKFAIQYGTKTKLHGQYRHGE